MMYESNTRRRRWPWVLAAVAAALLAGGGVAVGLALMADDPATPAEPRPAVATQPAATEPAEQDPYEVWLERAPADAPELSRDDALARATLGCGQEWPPGTTDAVLQEVYADYVNC